MLKEKGKENDEKKKRRAIHITQGIFIFICLGLVISLPVLLSWRLHNYQLFTGQSKKARDLYDSQDLEREQTQVLRYHAMAMNKVKKETIQYLIKKFASKPHFPGSNQTLEQAKYIRKQLKINGWDKVVTKNYKALMSYASLASTLLITDENNRVLLSFQSTFKNSPKESHITNPELPPYIAFSKGGTSEGRLIYANHGKGDDYRHLKSHGVKVNGSIALVRYGAISRGQKVVAAIKQGVIGLIIFSDPEEVNPHGISYPNSWYLPEDGVQFGNINRYRGDPLSPGYPSVDSYYRTQTDNYDKLFSGMIMMPISYGKAKDIFSQFRGKPVQDASWIGKLNVTYRTTLGNGLKARITTDVFFQDKLVRNIIATIVGATEPDRYVIIGNHRDAWCFGAADPTSGTAALVEVARVLGWLKSQGWRPRRTIILASWDAEEMGLYGSTEWCEEFAGVLSRQTVIYINVDTVVEGHYSPKLFTSPHARDAFYDVIKRINFPRKNQSLYDYWVSLNEDPKFKGEPRVRLFSSGSDYMHFFATLGIPSMDFRYTYKEALNSFKPFPTYHTVYDNIDWVKKFVDPDFIHHKIMADIWVQVTLLFSDSVIIPFNVRRYGDTIKEDKESILSLMKKLPHGRQLSLEHFEKVCDDFIEATYDFQRFVVNIDKRNPLETRMLNDRLMLLERTFTTVEDFPEEQVTRHVYQFNRLEKLLHDMKKRSNFKALQDEFKMKLTFYLHHIRMATQYLKMHTSPI